MDTPQERVEILRQEVEAFKRRAATLAPEDWDRPSACEGWTVADVAAHLVGQAFALTVARGLNGDFTPPPGAPPVTSHNEDDFARNIFQRAFNTRAEVGNRLPDILGERLDEAVQVFDTVLALEERDEELALIDVSHVQAVHPGVVPAFR